MSVARQAAGKLERSLTAFVHGYYDAEAHAIDYAAATISREFGEVRRAIDTLAIIDPATMTPLTARLAFWLNLYNAVVLEAVAEQPGVASVRDIDDFFTLPRRQVGDHEFSLDDIEHGILRGNARRYLGVQRMFGHDDPRLAWVLPTLEPLVHFGLYTASVAAPPLRVFSGERLREQITDAATAVLQRDSWLADDGRTMYLPKTFYWYESDFGKRHDRLRLLRDHLPEDDERRHAIDRLGSRLRFDYTEYNWMLNDRYTLAL